MSRHRIPVDGRLAGHTLLFGWDRSFGTYYAQLWAPGVDPEGQTGPLKVCGYHPTERVTPYADYYGPYPLMLVAALVQELRSWGVELPGGYWQRLAWDRERSL